MEKELKIETVLATMKQLDFEYNFKEKGKKHQYIKDGKIVITFIDNLDYISKYVYNPQTKKYDLQRLYTNKDLQDAISK